MKRTACYISVFSVFHRSPKCKSSLIRRYKLYTRKGRKWIIRKPVTYFAKTTFDSWKYLIISGLLQWLLRQHETTPHFIIYSCSILKQAETISFHPHSCCDYVACTFYDKRNQISFRFCPLCIIDFRKLNRCQLYHVFHNTYEITGLNSLSEFSNFRENRRPWEPVIFDIYVEFPEISIEYNYFVICDIKKIQTQISPQLAFELQPKNRHLFQQANLLQITRLQLLMLKKQKTKKKQNKTKQKNIIKYKLRRKGNVQEPITT